MDTVQDIWKDELDWTQPIWRYFKTARLEQLLDESRLYFAAGTQFTDPFEGAVAVQDAHFFEDPRYAEMGMDEHAFFALKELTKVNCSHRAEYESNAMWHLYAGEGKGVAIRSTPERMKAALRPFRIEPNYGAENLHVGVVKYVDLTQVRLREPSHRRFFYKHRAFEWEREFRLIVSLAMASEFVAVPDKGVQVEVDVDALVERIVLGPSLSSDDRERIVEHARKAGFAQRVELSSMLGRPRYL